MSRLSEQERDQRDLRILELLDKGLTQAAAAEAMGVTRGLVSKLVSHIRADIAVQPYPERERAQ
jgi:predicted transcriptional regulator